MDRAAVLAAFEEQVRQRARPDTPDGHSERDAHVIRIVDGGDGFNGVVWSDLDEATADAAIAAEVSRFAREGRKWEWKHYSYDRPPDLAERLLAAGFTSEPPETLLVAEIAELSLEPLPPPGVELRPVTGEDDVAALVRVVDEAFGERHETLGRLLLAQLGREPPDVAAVVAFGDGAPVAAGRVELPRSGDFAGLWGAGTVPAWRHRGVFRALVAHRAAIAAARGFRYLTVDASADSEPILRRLGFVELATTTPYIHPGGG
jgi:ribosomal protein S18 acetylase RimI-like enzyme